jgi:tRNA(fMet)-specific endonuclease VapC
MEEATRGASRSSQDRGPELDRLILDTSILVVAEKAVRRLDEVLGDEDDIVIAAVTAAELLVGVELSTKRYRASREAFVEAVLRTIPVEPYDLDVARAHARLLGSTTKSGRSRGAHDLIIAATAVARDRTVVTADPHGFEGLPGVPVRPS